MDTLPFSHDFDLDATAADLRPSSQDAGSGAPVDEKSTKIYKYIRRAHSPPSNHSQRDTRDAKGQHKSPNVYDNSHDDGIISEEQENGNVNLGDGSDEQEEALQALESYAAFQVALLRYLTDDSTFKEHPRQILFPAAVFQSGPLSEPSMSDSACESQTHLERPLTAMGRTNSRSALS